MRNNLENAGEFRIFKRTKKRINMNIDETNITMIHSVLINDLKTRLFKQHNEGKVRNPFTIVTDEDHQDDIAQMVSWVHKCASVNDINKLLTHYGDLFIDEDKMLESQTDYALLLSWHISDELVPRLRQKGFIY